MHPFLGEKILIWYNNDASTRAKIRIKLQRVIFYFTIIRVLGSELMSTPSTEDEWIEISEGNPNFKSIHFKINI